jgi:hypothetical protein
MVAGFNLVCLYNDESASRGTTVGLKHLPTIFFHNSSGSRRSRLQNHPILHTVASPKKYKDLKTAAIDLRFPVFGLFCQYEDESTSLGLTG